VLDLVEPVDRRMPRDEGDHLRQIANRGHSLTVDGGWREVANTSVEFVQRFVKP
jgi:hypothetical protein